MRKIGKKVVISMVVGALTISSFSMSALAAGRNHGANRQSAVCTNQNICDGTGSGNNNGVCDGTGSGNNNGVCDGTGSAKIKTPNRSGVCRR